MKLFSLFVLITIILKFIFIGLSLLHVFFKIRGKDDTKLDSDIQWWRDRVEFVFKIMLALLMIYLFNPIDKREKLLTTDTKTLLYIYGFILLFTADWSDFFTKLIESKKKQQDKGKSQSQHINAYHE